MVKGRTRKLLFSGVFAFILTAVLAAGFSYRGAEATEFNMSIEPFLTVDFPAFIFIDASPNYTDLQTADAKLRVSTNEEGYVVVISGDRSIPGDDNGVTTSLVNISENAYIPTLTSQKSKLEFPVGYWGFSMDGGENYRGLTPYNDANRLVLDSSQMAATTTEFTFGVKIDDVQPAGIYNSTILLTAVATMDDIPDPVEIRAKALRGNDGRLVFVYDDQHYEVGDPYITNEVNMAIENVFEVPQVSVGSGSIGWSNDSGINTVIFEDSFQYFEPLTTNSWFYGLSGLNKIQSINNLNMSRVTSTNYMFAYAHLAPEIGDLDVSHVSDMTYTFYYFCNGGCYGSLDLSRWNTSNVTNMGAMFYGINNNISDDSATLSFLGSIRNWDVSHVTNMGHMFAYAYRSSSDRYTSWSFSFDLSNWDVSNVTAMNHMFYYVASSVSSRRSISVYINMDNLDMRNVRELQYMFYGAADSDTFHLIANNWQLNSATNISYLLSGASHAFGSYTLRLHGWKINNSLSSFNIGGTGANSVDVDLSDWQMPNPGDFVKNLIVKSEDATSWKMNFSGWMNTNTITDLSGLFADMGYHSGYNSSFYLNVTGWNTSNVTNMSRLFGDCWYHNIEIVGIENWDTRKVTNMYQAFRRFGGGTYYSYDSWDGVWRYIESSGSFNDSGLRYSLANWDFSNVVNMNGMFEYSAINSSIKNTIENWNVGKVTSMSRMFYMAGINANLNLGNWNVINVTNMSEMFSEANLRKLSLVGWQTNSLSNMDKMFKNAYISDSSRFSCDYVYDAQGYNHIDYVCEVIDADPVGIFADNLNTSRITDMKELFMGLEYNYFSACSSVYNPQTQSYDRQVCYTNPNPAVVSIKNWDTRNVLYMDYMFNLNSGTGISLDGIADIDVSNVVSMSHMFQNFNTNPTVWNYDFSNWDMASVTDLSYMFSNIESASREVALNFAGFNSASALNMSYMFYNVGANANTFSIVFGNDFDTSSVRDMRHMFENAGAKARTFTMDLRGFNTSKVQNMSYMLFNAGKTAATFSVNIDGWDVSNVYDREYFCDRLEMVQPNWL